MSDFNDDLLSYDIGDIIDDVIDDQIFIGAYEDELLLSDDDEKYVALKSKAAEWAKSQIKDKPKENPKQIPVKNSSEIQNTCQTKNEFNKLQETSVLAQVQTQRIPANIDAAQSTSQEFKTLPEHTNATIYNETSVTGPNSTANTLKGKELDQRSYISNSAASITNYSCAYSVLQSSLFCTAEFARVGPHYQPFQHPLLRFPPHGNITLIPPSPFTHLGGLASITAPHPITNPLVQGQSIPPPTIQTTTNPFAPQLLNSLQNTLHVPMAGPHYDPNNHHHRLSHPIGFRPGHVIGFRHPNPAVTSKIVQETQTAINSHIPRVQNDEEFLRQQENQNAINSHVPQVQNDKELLRQQEEFINKNRKHIEKLRHAKDVSPRRRSRSRQSRSRSRTPRIVSRERSYTPPKRQPNGCPNRERDRDRKRSDCDHGAKDNKNTSKERAVSKDREDRERDRKKRERDLKDRERDRKDRERDRKDRERERERDRERERERDRKDRERDRERVRERDRKDREVRERDRKDRERDREVRERDRKDRERDRKDRERDRKDRERDLKDRKRDREVRERDRTRAGPTRSRHVNSRDRDYENRNRGSVGSNCGKRYRSNSPSTENRSDDSDDSDFSGHRGRHDNDRDKSEVEENEETRTYRLQIEKQKALREQIIRYKEIKRRRAVEEQYEEERYDGHQQKDDTPLQIIAQHRQLQNSHKLQEIVVERKIILLKKRQTEHNDNDDPGTPTQRKTIPTAKITPEVLVKTERDKCENEKLIEVVAKHKDNADHDHDHETSTQRKTIPTAKIMPEVSVKTEREKCENEKLIEVVAEHNDKDDHETPTQRKTKPTANILPEVLGNTASEKCENEKLQEVAAKRKIFLLEKRQTDHNDNDDHGTPTQRKTIPTAKIMPEALVNTAREKCEYEKLIEVVAKHNDNDDHETPTQRKTIPTANILPEVLLNTASEQCDNDKLKEVVYLYTQRKTIPTAKILPEVLANTASEKYQNEKLKEVESEYKKISLKKRQAEHNDNGDHWRHTQRKTIPTAHIFPEVLNNIESEKFENKKHKEVMTEGKKILLKKRQAEHNDCDDVETPTQRKTIPTAKILPEFLVNTAREKCEKEKLKELVAEHDDNEISTQRNTLPTANIMLEASVNTANEKCENEKHNDNDDHEGPTQRNTIPTANILSDVLVNTAREKCENIKTDVNVSKKILKTRERYRMRKAIRKEIMAASLYEGDDFRLYVNIKICNNEISGLLDSGATVACLGKGCLEFVQRTGLPVFDFNFSINTVDGSRHKIVGSIRAKIDFNKISEKITFYLVPTLNRQLFLGVDFMKKFNLLEGVSSLSTSGVSLATANILPEVLVNSASKKCENKKLKEVVSEHNDNDYHETPTERNSVPTVNILPEVLINSASEKYKNEKLKEVVAEHNDNDDREKLTQRKPVPTSNILPEALVNFASEKCENEKLKEVVAEHNDNDDREKLTQRKTVPTANILPEVLVNSTSEKCENEKLKVMAEHNDKDDHETLTDRKTIPTENILPAVLGNTASEKCENTKTDVNDSQKLLKAIDRYNMRKKIRKQIMAASLYEGYNFRSYVNIKICNNEISGLLDKGSTVSCLGKGCLEFVQKTGVPVSDFNFFIKTVDGSPHKIVGSIRAKIDFYQASDEMTFYLVPTLKRTLFLGMDFIKKFNLLEGESSSSTSGVNVAMASIR